MVKKSTRLTKQGCRSAGIKARNDLGDAIEKLNLSAFALRQAGLETAADEVEEHCLALQAEWRLLNAVVRVWEEK